MADHEEDAGEAVDTSMRIDAHVTLACIHCRFYYSVSCSSTTDQPILEHNHAWTVAALADKLNMPQLSSLLHHYLHSQLHATDPRNPDNIPPDECPFYDGPLHVFNSACSTFFAPSDLIGIYDMHHKYICSCPMWQDGNPCLDCVFVVTDPQMQGMHGLDIVCVLCFFFHSSI